MSVEVQVEGERLTVRFHGWQAPLGVFWKSTVPLSSISRVQTMSAEEARTQSGRQVKLAGTRIPGIVKAGTFGWGEHKQLWSWHRQNEVLVVDLKGERYERLVLDVEDPESVATRIEQAR